MRRNSQACPIWCSYENQGETLLSTCGYTCTNFSSGSKRKRRIEKLLKVGVNSLFYVMVDCEILTYLKKKIDG